MLLQKLIGFRTLIALPHQPQPVEFCQVAPNNLVSGYFIIHNQAGERRDGEGEISFVLRADIAEMSGITLTSTCHENKIHDISAPTAWSFSDIAAPLSQPGKPVTYIDSPMSAFEAELQKHLSALTVKSYVGAVEGVRQNEFNQPDPTLENLLICQPVDLEAYVKIGL